MSYCDEYLEAAYKAGIKNAELKFDKFMQEIGIYINGIDSEELGEIYCRCMREPA